VPRREIKRNPREARSAHFHDDHGNCMTAADVRSNCEHPKTRFIEITNDTPFECRDRRSHGALLAERLRDLMDFNPAAIDITTIWFVDAIELPKPAPPPLVSARTSTAPPSPPKIHNRVKVHLTI
jgi:hypothetical protein